MTAVQAVDQRRSHSALIAALLGAAGAFLGFNLLLSAVPVIADAETTQNTKCTNTK